MKNKGMKLLGLFCCSAVLMMGNPTQVRAAGSAYSEIGVETTTTMTARIDAPNVDLYQSADQSSQIVGKAGQGKTYQVLGVSQDGWARVMAGDTEGYLKVSRNATLVEKTQQTVDKSVTKRKEIVNYAMQFVGNRYVYGGTDPNRGVDCSGFTRYVLSHTAGVDLPHSAAAQSRLGKPVSADSLRPGDLLFYSGGGAVNHVAMYIGNGQVVHAANAKSGIKISQYNYRKPVRMSNMLGD